MIRLGLSQLSVLLIGLLIFGGCAASLPDEQAASVGEPGQAVPGGESSTEGPAGEDKNVGGGGLSAQGDQGQQLLTLYFGDRDSEKVVPELREAAAVVDAEAIVEALISGPKDDTTIATIPRGTALRSASIEGAVATVDFSREFVENHPGGSAGEIATVASVVASLTELPAVERVRFLVEGKPIESLAGHLDLSQPVERDPDWVK